MADLDSVSVLLKEVWASQYEQAFQDEIVALRRIERMSDGIMQDVSGRYTIIPLKVTRSQGIGSRAERTTLPSPGQQGWSSSKVTLRYQYAVGDITAQALDLADVSERSFINTFDEEQTGLLNDAVFDYARQVYGTSTGTIATVSSEGGGTVTVSDRTMYLQRGEKIDIVNTGGPALRNTGALTVDSVDHDNNQFDFSGTASGIASGDVVVRRGNYNLEVNGFTDAIATSSPFQQVDTAVVPEWVARVTDHSSANYTDKAVFKELDYIRRTASKTPTVLFTGLGVWRSIYDYLDGERRFVNTVEFAHGVDGIPLHYKGRTLPIVDDPHFPEDFGASAGDILGICEDDVAVYKHEKGWHFDERSGSMFIPASDRSDAWEFRLRQFSNLGYKLRNTHFRLQNVAITA